MPGNSQNKQNQSDFLRLLRTQFEIRCKRNPRYSMRAFARDLDISASRLSEIFSGKHGVSSTTAIRFADKLFESENEKNYFVDTAEATHARSKVRRELAASRIQARGAPHGGYKQLQEDQFAIIADWYHYAILELVAIEAFDGTPKWIASRLNIAESVAEAAIDRLIRVGQLELRADGRLVPVDSYSATTDGISSASLRKFHRQILEKANHSLDAQNVDERDITTITLSFDSRRLAEAKAMIKDFRRQFDQRFSTGGNKDSVYNLGIQFFALTEGKIQ